MPGPLVNVASTILCAHGGQVKLTMPSPRVTIAGSPAATIADVSTVAACPFVTGGNPMPCVTAQWLVGATRVMIGGVPALLQSSSSTCIPNGTPATIAATQPRVTGT